jgi:hypothetical protein
MKPEQDSVKNIFTDSFIDFLSPYSNLVLHLFTLLCVPDEILTSSSARETQQATPKLVVPQ